MTKLRSWLDIKRIVPIVTILAAGTAVFLSLIGRLVLSPSESIVISLLGLLAIDALGERIGLLEKIEEKLRLVSGTNGLRPSKTLPGPLELAREARTVWILGVSGAGAIAPYLRLYAERMQAGCELRVVLLDPQSAAFSFLVEVIAKTTKVRMGIESSLEALKELGSVTGCKGTCEVRLSETFYPFSMYSVDPDSPSGRMVVEYHSYNLPVVERPHVILTAAEDAYWFEYYRQQFNAAWERSRPSASGS